MALTSRISMVFKNPKLQKKKARALATARQNAQDFLRPFKDMFSIFSKGFYKNPNDTSSTVFNWGLASNSPAIQIFPTLSPSMDNMSPESSDNGSLYIWQPKTPELTTSSPTFTSPISPTASQSEKIFRFEKFERIDSWYGTGYKFIDIKPE